MQNFIDYLYSYSDGVGLAFEIIVTFFGIVLIIAFVSLIVFICIWAQSVSETVGFIDDNYYSLRYVLREFDKVKQDTANNSVICNELKCQKSAKDSSRK